MPITPPDELNKIREALLPQMAIRRFGDGAFIHGPEHPSNLFFWVIEGAVRFSNVTEDGNSIELFTLGVDECFGELNLFSNLAPPQMAHAVGDTAVKTIGKAKLRQILSENPLILDWMLTRMSVRLHRAFRLIDELRAFSPRNRIWRHLVWLSETGFAKVSASGGYEISIKQADLANRLDMSRATLATVLKSLRTEGRIATRYGCIEVLRLD
ncbi:MAG: Crp/Fnr family transcriptional regulator [Hyphococcus sp.]